MKIPELNYKALSCYIFIAHSILLFINIAEANTRFHEDYIAIDIEAEAFDQSTIEDDDIRWTLTDPTTPQTEQDPDGNHSGGAVGNKYLELLPDIRVRHGDPFGPPTALWGDPGTGPELSYEVNFPESGRYYVHVRASSSGSEDNGIHAGINETWPVSGNRMQLCAINKGWQWTSRKRLSGGVGYCGVDHSIWLDVEQAGINTVMFSAREDGFELDRFMLIKHLQEGARVCSASGENDVICADGYVETADGFVDAEVDLLVDRNAGVKGNIFTFSAEVSNEDGFDTANDVTLDISVDFIEDWEFVSASSACSAVATGIYCELGNHGPTFPRDEEIITVSLEALSSGEKEVAAQVNTSSNDEVLENNQSSVVVSVEQGIAYTVLENVSAIEPLVPYVLDEIVLGVTIRNVGNESSTGTQTMVDLPESLELLSMPDECEISTTIVCTVEDIPSGEDSLISFSFTTDVEGVYPIEVQQFADNIAEGSFSDIFSVEVLSALKRGEVESSSVSNSENPENPDSEDNTSTVNAVDSLQTSGVGGTGSSFLFLLLLILFFRITNRVCRYT